MKQKILICCLAVAVLLAFSGCSQEETDARTLDTFTAAFTDAGVTLENQDKPAYELIGATDGVMFYIDTNVVKIYQYDSSSALADAQAEFGDLMSGMPTNGKFLLETTNEQAIEIFNNVAK